MLHEYHVIYSVRYYPRFHLTVVGLGTYYPWIRGLICILKALVWKPKNGFSHCSAILVYVIVTANIVEHTLTFHVKVPKFLFDNKKSEVSGQIV
jgi:hypothetical protein